MKNKNNYLLNHADCSGCLRNDMNGGIKFVNVCNLPEEISGNIAKQYDRVYEIVLIYS
jgi:hypothetical protein